MDATNKGSFATAFDAADGGALFLFAMEAVSVSTFVLLLLVVWWTMLSFEAFTSFLSANSTSKLRTLCLVSLFSFCCMSGVAVLFMNNFVIPLATANVCRAVIPFYFVCYNMGKVCMHWLASYHQQNIFNADLYSKPIAVSRTSSALFRIFCALASSLLWGVFLFLGFDEIAVVTIPESRYAYCSMRTFQFVSVAQALFLMVGILDVLCRGFMLFLFMAKSVALTRFYRQNITAKKRDILLKLHRLTSKTNVLQSVAMLSTLLFFVGATYFYQSLIYFFVVDAVIGALCTIQLFEFGDPFYRRTCAHCESLCICIYCMRRRWHELRIHNEKEPLLITQPASIHHKDKATFSSDFVPVFKTSVDCTGTHKTSVNTTESNATSSTKLKLYDSTITVYQQQQQSTNEKRNRTNTTITAWSEMSERTTPLRSFDISSEKLIVDRRNSLLPVTEFL